MGEPVRTVISKQDEKKKAAKDFSLTASLQDSAFDSQSPGSQLEILAKKDRLVNPLLLHRSSPGSPGSEAKGRALKGFILIITVDSREQNGITFSVGDNISAVKIDGLPFADYWCEWEPGSEAAGYDCTMPVCFERKNISDLFGTLTGGYERFKRELERAKENKFKLILIVEGTLSEVLAGTKYSEIKGSRILKTMMTLWVKYDIIPVFCPNRSEMRRYMIETWEAIGRNFKPKEASAVS